MGVNTERRDDSQVTSGFSTNWKEAFLRTRSDEQTALNVAFLQRLLPLPYYPRILDVCCGSGRHAGPLSLRGYDVTGIDVDEELVTEAAEQHPQASFLHLDMRRLDDLGASFDAVICIWQSFGYFDEETNASVLRSMTGRLRSGGRLVFDLYYREWFETDENQDFETSIDGISTHSHYSGSRLSVGLVYPDGETEGFEWQLFSPSDLEALGMRFGLRPVIACSSWDVETPPTNQVRDFQLVLEKL